MKKRVQEPLTARAFAKEMGIDYRTALSWLRKGLVPGASEKQSPIGSYWEIPVSALKMEKPLKPGPKPKKAGEGENPKTRKVRKGENS